MVHPSDTNHSDKSESAYVRRIRVIVAVLAGLVFFTTILIASAQIRDNYDSLIDSEKRAARNLARSGESHAIQMFNEAQRILEGIGNLYLDRQRLATVDEAFFHNLLKTSVQSSNHLDALYLLDRNGYALATGNTYPLPLPSRSISLIDQMGISTDETGFHMGPFNRSSARSGRRIAGRWFVPVIFPLVDTEAVIQGYVVGIIDPAVFQSFYATMEVGAHGMVMLMEKSGVIVAGNQNAQWEVGETVQQFANRIAELSASSFEDPVYTYVAAEDGSPVVSSQLDMGDYGLWLSVTLDGRDFLAPWNQTRFQIMVEATVFLAVILALSWVLLRQLNRIELSERDLLAAKNEAEQANQVKVQFLAQVSHEFRTPLNAIIGFSQAIRDRVFGADFDAKYSEYADDIHDSGQHLLDLVNDIIEVSRIEAGEYTVNATRVNVRECLDKVVAMLTGLASQRSISISTSYEDPSLHIMTDERLLKQVMINLISNAIKFSDKRSDVALSVAGQRGGVVRITVSDQGKGIHDSILKRIGEPFLVESSQVNVEGQGSGLGLSIAKTCMDLMGGTLDVDSTLGEGTRASLTLPVR